MAYRKFSRNAERKILRLLLEGVALLVVRNLGQDLEGWVVFRNTRDIHKHKSAARAERVQIYIMLGLIVPTMLFVGRLVHGICGKA